MDKELELLNYIVKFMKDHEKEMDEYAIDRITQYLADRYVTEHSPISLRHTIDSINHWINKAHTRELELKGAR